MKPMPMFVPPPGDPRVRYVESVEALLAAQFEGACSAICLRRSPDGDFEEVLRSCDPGEPSAPVDLASLAHSELSPAGQAATAFLQRDLQLLAEAGHAPSLECVRSYARDRDGLLATDVYSFHVDRAPVPAVTFLCTYAGQPSEGLFPDEAERMVDDPKIRARALALFGGPDGPAFCAFLGEQHYDLHYRPAPGARPFSFGRGNLWKLAVQYPDAPVPALIHRAPAPEPEPRARLILIS